MRRKLPALSAVLAVFLALSTMPAKAADHESIHETFMTMEALVEQLADQANEALVTGGVIVSANRNTISGGAMGCAVGAAAVAGWAAALGGPVGGASLGAAPDALIVGCALGAAEGAALGYPLDHPNGR